MAAVIGADRLDMTGGRACVRRSFVVAALLLASTTIGSPPAPSRCR